MFVKGYGGLSFVKKIEKILIKTKKNLSRKYS